MREQPLENSREELFAQMIVAGVKPLDAYVTIGKSNHVGHASRFRNRPLIAARIDYLTHQALLRTGITKEMILEEMRKLATSDVGKLFHPDGTPKLVTELDDETRAAVAGVTVSRDPKTRKIRHNIRLHDKSKALETLGKAFGAWIDRVEMTGADGEPLQPLSGIEIVAVPPRKDETAH